MKTAIIFLALGMQSACAQEPASPACVESRGSSAVARGDYAEAFELLKGCGDRPEASAQAILQLAMLYSWHNADPGMPSAARAQRSFLLFTEAARRGSVDAALTLASIYESGDSAARIRADPRIARCLERAADADSESVAQAVRTCLE